jgi:hypothetical protein
MDEPGLAAARRLRSAGGRSGERRAARLAVGWRATGGIIADRGAGSVAHW